MKFWVYILVMMVCLPAYADDKAAKIIVYKSELEMVLLDAKGKTLKRYDISLGSNPTGHKRQEGDMRTPEGKYTISGRNPHSQYHKSLRISYPNAKDREQARKRGVSPGGDIMIHGFPRSMSWMSSDVAMANNWTQGCIAVKNSDMDEIWDRVDNGTPIELLP